MALLALTRAHFLDPAPTIVVRDRQGRWLGEAGSGPDGELGFWPLPALPPRVAAATIAVEDRRFAWHPGVDPLAAGRALLQNFRSARRVSGASTLAMQVARMQRPGPRGYLRKGVEALTAVALTARYGREGVLAQYLRLAPYGNRIHGIAFAARRYLDKPVEDLSWAEVAFLTAIPQAPGRMNPYRLEGRLAAIARGRRILALLAARGDISPADLRLAEAQIQDLAFPPRPARPPEALHALLRFAAEMEDPAARKALGARPIVDTSLDLDLQREAARTVARHLSAYEDRGAGNAALLIADRRTREVLAAVASAGYFDPLRAGAIDYTRVPRSPGSILKPFLYALALDRGVIGPATILDDLQRGAGGITNSDERFLGPLLPRVALANSRNVPAVNLLARIGLEDGAAFLRELGLDDTEQPARHFGLGLALGGLPVTLEHLVRAYTVLAGDGRFGDLVWLRDPPLGPLPRPLIAEDTARLITLFLADPQARLPSFPRMGATEYPFPVALKTGTSSNYRDAWTVAWSNRFIVGAWVGHPENRPMDRLSGATSAAELVREVLLALHPGQTDGQSDLSFPPPSGWRPARLCALSGALATPACPAVFEEWFPPRNEPVHPCAVHQRLAIDARTGLPAQAATPPEAVDVRTFARLDARYAAWAAHSDLRLSPAAAPDLAGPRLAGREVRLRITQPEAGVRFLRDPETPPALATLALSAVVDPPVPQIVWYVDGAPWQVADFPYTVRWPVTAGAHTFQVRLPHAAVASNRVEVRVE